MSKKKDEAYNGIFKTKPYIQQKKVINFLRTNQISIIHGEAGTAKDFCCLYRGLDAIDTREHEELVLMKPIVELGQSIGYLPGDEADKTEPYEKSFYSNITKMIGKSNLNKFKKKIKFEPIQFLRGDTIEYSTVILSEAQNCTLHELISVVTRIASSSKLFINGDLFQSDIGRKSGFRDFINIMKDIDGIDTMFLDEEHQVRNPLIVEVNRNYRDFLNGKSKTTRLQTQDHKRAV